ncbi:MAG: DNA translocase FtsK, partial [Mucinivorans sp.]
NLVDPTNVATSDAAPTDLTLQTSSPQSAEQPIASGEQVELSAQNPSAQPMIDRSLLLPLEGDQWGYIFDWQVSGAPVYCYLDRVALAAARRDAPGAHAASVAASVAASMVAAKAKEKELPAEDDHDVEFIVKSYNSVSALGDTANVIEKSGLTEPSPQSAAGESSASAIGSSDVAKQMSGYSAAPSTMPSTMLDSEMAATRKVHFAPSPDDPNFIVEQSGGDNVLDDRTINLSELYDPTRELASYKKPPVELLKDHSRRVSVSDDELVENKNRIVHTLETFGIKIDTIEATIGPTVTLYEIIPAPGVRISKIKNLEDDIALSLSALGIRIIAPIPGRGTIGIEVPNKEKETVSMYSVIKSAKFQDSKAELPIALGKTIQNETFVLDLAKMPHLLVAGATGQGKSVGLNAIITSLLYKKHPSQLKFILVDPKKVELTLYSKLEKHFLAKMPGEDEAIITDTQKVIYTLNSICVEMDARYDLLKAAKVRNISEYNDKFTHRHLNPEKGHRFLPYFVVIIDEFADLIMTAGREVEQPIARIAQLARAVGIHMVIATQRP